MFVFEVTVYYSVDYIHYNEDTPKHEEEKTPSRHQITTAPTTHFVK